MDAHTSDVLVRLLGALLAGSLIGLERAYTGRPAGLRTHTLVCLSSSLLMVVASFQWQLVNYAPIDTIRVDPTRMAQGIMTGIGFLGAGAIMKEKFTIRGLTTAASIWVTASIGIVIGIGFFSAAIAATIITLIVLSAFSWFEKQLPARHFCRLVVRFKTREVMTREKFNDLLGRLHIRWANPSYQLEDEGRYLEYRMTVYSRQIENFQKLAESLSALENIHEFTIMPTGE